MSFVHRIRMETLRPQMSKAILAMALLYLMLVVDCRMLLLELLPPHMLPPRC
jgi:hypothetical protein